MAIIDLKGWNEVSENAGDYRKLPAGGYVCRILRAELHQRFERTQLFLFLDIAEGDFAGYFKAQNRETWSNNALFSRYVYDDSSGKITPAIKSLLVCVEKSNHNFKLDLQNFNTDSLVGKLCGFSFGEREYFYKDSLRLTTEVRFPVAADKIRSGDFTIPPLKELPKEPSRSKDDDFHDMPF